MGFCVDMIGRVFPTEQTEMRAAAVSLDSLIAEYGAFESITRDAAMKWVSASGLNIVSSGRKMRVFAATAAELGIDSVLDGVTYDDIDFSDDLQRSFFGSYQEMMGYISYVISRKRVYRDDSGLITEALITLIWDGVPQNHIVMLNTGDAPTPQRLYVACGGMTYPISPESYFILKELFDRRMDEAGPGKPLFANKVNGARWHVNNSNDVIIQLNGPDREKKIMATKLKDNGAFCRMIDYIHKNKGATVRTAAEAVIGKSERKAQNMTRAFYHWQKFFKIY